MLLVPAQGINGGIVRRTLGPTVPAVIIVGAVLVVFAIGLVVFLIVTDEVVEREAIMAGNKIDAGLGLAPVALIQIATAT